MWIMDSKDYGIKGKLYGWKTDWKREGTDNLELRWTHKKSIQGLLLETKRMWDHAFLKNLSFRGSEAVL